VGYSCPILRGTGGTGDLTTSEPGPLFQTSTDMAVLEVGLDHSAGVDGEAPSVAASESIQRILHGHGDAYPHHRQTSALADAKILLLDRASQSKDGFRYRAIDAFLENMSALGTGAGTVARDHVGKVPDSEVRATYILTALACTPGVTLPTR
jgi:hypothetical protein